jgi:hypothetical protein
MRIAAVASIGALLALSAPAAAAGDRCTEPGTPLFGVVRTDAGRVLAQIERRTLRPRADGIALPRGVTGWNSAFSPGCDAVALPGLIDGKILLVDLEGGRRVGTVSAGGPARAGAIAWSRPDRLTAFAGPYSALRLVTLSIPDGRIVASRRLGGDVAASEATSLGMVVVVEPRKRIGPATLVLATPDGAVLRAPLTRIRAGFAWGNRRLSLGRQLVPGLAVDEDSGRAYVVTANEPLVAEVDLVSGAVSYHELRGGGPASGSATASKGVSYAAYRNAEWVGDGTIAVSGEETQLRRGWRRAWRRGELANRIEPYGLRLIDTADWTVDTVHRSLRWFLRTGDALVGADTVPVTMDRSRATGLVAFGLDGRRRFGRFPDNERIGLWGAAWPYAYVTVRRPHRRTYVVDLRSGRTAKVLPTVRLPWILTLIG